MKQSKQNLTCSHVESPHKRHRWSRGFWDRRCRAGAPVPGQGSSTQPWTPQWPTPDSWSHSPPPWACPAPLSRCCSRWLLRSLTSDTRPRRSEIYWSARRTAAEEERQERQDNHKRGQLGSNERATKHETLNRTRAQRWAPPRTPSKQFIHQLHQHNAGLESPDTVWMVLNFCLIQDSESLLVTCYKDMQ